MDITSSSPEAPVPNQSRGRHKDKFAEPPMKDFSYLLHGELKAPQRPRKSRAFLLFLIIAGFGIIISAAIYWLYAKPAPLAEPSHAKTAQSAKAPPVAAQTSFSSPGFNLSLQYPSNWSINDNGAVSLTLTSPVTKLLNNSGHDVNAKILFLVLPQGQVPSAYGTSNAMAVLPSQLVVYTNPAMTQAAQTYISFVQYSGATLVGTLDAIYVTGNYGYQKDQSIPISDLKNVSPLIYFSFGQCKTTSCTTLEPLSLSSREWQNQSFNQSIQGILKSLVLH